MDQLGHLGWVAQLSCVIDGRIFGIRTNSQEAADWLADALQDHLAPDEESDPNFSVWIGEGGLGKRYHVLYRDSIVIGRTFDVGALAKVLCAEIEALTFARRTDALYLDAGIVRRAGVTGLVGADLIAGFDELGRRSARAGLQLPISRFAAVDLESAAFVPVTPILRVREEVLKRPPASFGTTQAGPQRFAFDAPTRVDGVFANGRLGDEPIAPTSRAAAVYSLGADVKNLSAVGIQGVEALSRALVGVRCWRLGLTRVAPMQDALIEGLDHVSDGVGAPRSAAAAGRS